MSRAEFAYAQARIQARLAARAVDADWKLLESSRDLGHCLEMAGRTPLRALTSSLASDSNVHRIEAGLRAVWAEEVDAISGWLPDAWKPAAGWMKPLPYLRRLDQDADRSPLLDWLRPEPALAAGWPPEPHGGAAHRPGAAGRWLGEWRARIPAPAWYDQMRQRLDGLLARYLGIRARDRVTLAATTDLSAQLVREIRAQPQTPVAVFASIGITALDFERLRGILCVRALFAAPDGGR